ncbi:MAG: hypothetical protein IKP45_03990 [Bacteroidales bacterium]|nr:hypothetical protein [Bacteroidales bacterium]
MKRVCVLIFLLFLCLRAFSQEITVRFTGQLNGTSYCSLDSVAVTNLTRNWTETIEYPDTIIVLGGTVEADLNIVATQGLGQNIPNPFDCETRVELSVSQRENVRMQLLDASGKQYADYRGSLDAGVHTFDISAAAPQTYIFNATVGNRSYSIRMVNMGSGCGSSIKYAGISGSITAKLTTANEFQNGDNMHYIGYVTIGSEVVASNVVEQPQTASEDITLNFTHCQPLAEHVEVTACDSYEWNNETYNVSGDYQQTFVAANGCDSVVTLHLTINRSNTGIDEQTACDSYTWIDGVTYTESTNEPTFTLTNAEGCDSVVTLHLTINHSNTGIDEQTACDSYTWIDGVTYTASTNAPIFTLTNAAGCDSVVTLHLTINRSNTGIDEQTACDSYTWIDGVTYTESTNEPTFTLTNAAGCDSVVTLHLTINHSNTGIDEQTACESYTWIDGITYTESTNEPTFTLTNAAGCDSIVTLHLTINRSNTGIDEQTVCDSYTWIDGVTYTESTNEPTFTLTNAAGCDSVVTLHLTINHSNTGIDEQTACDSYTWIDGVTYTESTNEPTFTLTNAVGCDSVVTLHLTMVCPPTVQTISATNITTTGATLSGNVNSDGGAIVTARGFMYGTSANNLSQTVESGSGNGSYTKALTDLSSNTTYYYKAYAINSIGTSYGEVMSFTTSCECGGSYKVTDYDGNQYNTVLIGEQCWMAENLKTTKFANGSSISYGIYSDAWDVQYPRISETVSYRYYPNNSSGNVSTYGYLYNWPAVMHGASSSSTNPSNVQGICPTGWHLPSEAEWTQLTSYLKTQSQHQCGGSTTNIGKSLASTSGWNSSTNTCAVGNTPANNNSTGFGAKPAGYFDPTGYVDNVSECVKYFKSYAVYWSASSGSGSYLSCFVIATSNTGANVVKSYYRKNFGASVRCVKD